MNLTLAVLIIVGIGLLATFAKILNSWKTTKKLDYNYGMLALAFSAFLVFFGNQYIKHKEFENNLNAVHNYFNDENVHYVSLDLTEVETNAGTYKIKVDEGIVFEAKKLKKKKPLLWGLF